MYLSDLGANLFEMAKFDYTASLMSFLLLYYSSPISTKQTRNCLATWHLQIHAPTKTVDRISYIFTFKALGLIVPGADQVKMTLL